jgi:DNA-directed RNA polymerase specialized sigma24 family protein
VLPLTPAEPPPTKPPFDDESDSDDAGRWELTQEAFEKLLDRFSPDHEEGSKQYLQMRLTLVRFFEWRSSPSPDDQVDTTVNRVARKIHEGKQIINLRAYFRKVASIVLLESGRDEERTWVPLEDRREIPAELPLEDDQKEARLDCLDECLDKLPSEDRRLILEYYFDVRRAKIDHRRQLAESTMNALRIRACRIRKKLEKCVKGCMQQMISK